LVCAAILLTFAIRPVFGGKAPLIFFTIAVVLSAAYSGLWAGVFTTLLSLVMTGWLFEHSNFLLTLSQSRLVLFAALGVTISAIIQLLQRANAEVVTAGAQLEVTSKALSQCTEALSRSNEELQRFAFAVAHDLQTPLRNIKTLTALLVRRNGDMEQDSKDCALGRTEIGWLRSFSNLLTNVIKYRSDQKPEIHITATDS
jgi:signal transduction histidine kinase